MTDLNKKQAFWAEQLPLFKENYICLAQLEAVEFNSETGNFDALTKNETGFDLEDILEAYHSVNTGWAMWLRAKSQEKAKAQAVPEGILVTKDQAKDTARLDFLLQEPRLVTTDINYDENYDKTGEGFCVNAVYWISGWERLTETVHQTKREAIDKAMIVESESGAEG